MKERYYSIDIYKLIAALLIVSVHTVLFGIMKREQCNGMLHGC